MTFGAPSAEHSKLFCMHYIMGQALARCIGGETDYDRNNVPDNKDIQRLIETYYAKERDKQAKRTINKIFRDK